MLFTPFILASIRHHSVYLILFNYMSHFLINASLLFKSTTHA
jgi:hypothetical protein